MQTIEMYHITYEKPKVTLLQHSGLGVAEIAARTCYDSFENSENACIKEAMNTLDTQAINAIDDSDLLSNLAWVHHHHSIIEHATLSYLIQGTSRGVLQEHARHRLQAISVRSTRYTMSSVINAFVASLQDDDGFGFFFETLLSLNLFVITDREYLSIEIRSIYDKLTFQYQKDVDFLNNAVAKSSLPYIESYKQDASALFTALQNGKKKRNVGDGFKHIVTDNWKVDMVVTFNIRSLKNYFDLRDSGAAWFQIQWLAEAMKEVTPLKYLKLIDKKYKTMA
ncbi:MAG TPA: FAD-dependent thymidylate synthase [Sulfurovum sp.]|jgi:thymidylate synthase (FAD)|nr:MAG: thymidylate synthase [Sulfurovum sp. 35-42-20]OYZ25586.1 MAG: thymidylate synthase [Sulfurovum sp. 16-42-52]OYZ49597.1 MAG: thymidylate synthase [Sulfurovum sp. 24-42-9]OZA45574.1 MAG: thymidylate synthase [Sulfurovum sp. 17-42-90]OZA61560.1 MAG: thymidylate synthase [Sulfurovum sp. 39-42-12]HQR74419.1 FAD-dependent thymidylate synthase [Sulfurovum sp.]